MPSPWSRYFSEEQRLQREADRMRREDDDAFKRLKQEVRFRREAMQILNAALQRARQ